MGPSLHRERPHRHGGSDGAESGGPLARGERASCEATNLTRMFGFGQEAEVRPRRIREGGADPADIRVMGYPARPFSRTVVGVRLCVLLDVGQHRSDGRRGQVQVHLLTDVLTVPPDACRAEGPRDLAVAILAAAARPKVQVAAAARAARAAVLVVVAAAWVSALAQVAAVRRRPTAEGGG